MDLPSSAEERAKSGQCVLCDTRDVKLRRGLCPKHHARFQSALAKISPEKRPAFEAELIEKLTGHDLDRQERRSYYLDSARSLRSIELPCYRLGTYGHVDGGAILLRGPVFTDSIPDLAAMQRVMRWAYRIAGSRRHPRRSIGIFQVGAA